MRREGSAVWRAPPGWRGPNRLARPPRNHRGAQQDLQSGVAGIRADLDRHRHRFPAVVVRGRFGGASTPVSAAAVSLIRAANQGRMDYWTVDELLKEP
jgi:hypothetical protein